MVETLAQERGLIATFMPKPFANLTGNGCHFHMSLWNDGENVFERDPADDPRGLGLSPLAYHFIGGLKAHAKAYIALTAPTVNSYKRLVVGAPNERADVGAGVHQLRLQQPHPDAADPGAGRIEDRTVDGSCNPYLAATAMLAAGLDGIERELDPGEPELRQPLRAVRRASAPAQGIELLPANLLDATRELEKDDVLRAALGKTRDGDYVDYFIKVKRGEWQQAHEQITAVGARPLPVAVLREPLGNTEPARALASQLSACSSEPTVCGCLASRRARPAR